MQLSSFRADFEDIPESLWDQTIVDLFLSWCESRGISLYPAQEESVMEIATGSHVILATPTGSGKSLVAVAAHFSALLRGQRSYYTAPIKALVSEKFFALCDIFGAENVGMLTGDASVNPDAPIICATAEIVAHAALRGGESAQIDQVVMDEFHYYSDPERGWAWQVPLIELGRAQFLLMSATLGDVSALRQRLTARTGRPTALIDSATRPVPLSYAYVDTAVPDTVELLLTRGQTPVYIVHFTQASAIERASALTSIVTLTQAQRSALTEHMRGFHFNTGFGKTLHRLLQRGIGVHHAGMLPKYRRLVEKLAQAGVLPVICGTDTLGVGINVPIRTVLFTGLVKFDGRRQRLLNAREFHQIAGRAGRAGFDTEGTVIVEAPEHEIENSKAVAKAAGDPKKLKKLSRKKPPAGEVNWTRASFDKLLAAEPEPMVSRFAMTSSMLLGIVSRPGNCGENVLRLVRGVAEPRGRQNGYLVRAIEHFRSLEDAGVVRKLAAPDPEGRVARVVAELQEDFALNQPLAPFALAAVELWDRDSPTYALDIISTVEAVIEDPRQVLFAQQRRARGEAIAALKADGVDYSDRMDQTEDISWPQPRGEELSAAFHGFVEGHPWMAQWELSPKSIVRDMVESGMSFADFVTTYSLARSEGVVLRYLTDCYRALRSSVPQAARSEELSDILEWLSVTIRSVDSSLISEWEALTAEGDPAAIVAAAHHALTDAAAPLITRNRRAFTVMVRNAMFRSVQLLARDAIEELVTWSAQISAVVPDWDAEIDPYWDEYDALDAGPTARGPEFFSATAAPELEGRKWRARQILCDPAGDHGWAVTAVVDLDASDEAGEVRLAELGLTAG